MDSCIETKSASSKFNGVTKSGRVWRKVPESDALPQSVSQKTKTKTHTVNALSKIRQNHSFEYQATTMTVVLVDHLLSHSQAHILLLCERCGLISDVM